MELKSLEKELLSKKGAKKEFPFGDNIMVFKVQNKMFALISWEENPLKINLKCEPSDAIAYREIYPCVSSGYHMNKKHWNTITIDGSMKEEIFKDMINDSYYLVVSKLTKKEKEHLSSL